jgi:hypothetical protein
VVVEYRRPIKAGQTILEVLVMHRVGGDWKTAGYQIMPEH